MRWIPNAISILRALASIPVVLLVAPGTALLALALFSAAALTDALDGALARKLRASSALGAFLDPLADKVLVLGTLGGLLAR
ncbi:MAG: CDP-alcohol phosphatidyltransferase family protein, partial [Chloroflexi bacterium]|nr:CDP-alcohol phosphatidyltransferase family protein [Chloroflexota bacterium]